MKRFLSFVTVLVLLAAFAYADDVVLKVGSKGDEVVRLQTRLIELGFLQGTADGSYGEMTAGAVRDFQSYLVDLGYKTDIDGIAGAQTRAFLYDASLNLEAPPIEYGSSGERVVRLQKKLLKLGILDAAADGSFGEQTKIAIERLQQAMVDGGLAGARVTGELDDLTLSVMDAVPESVIPMLPGGCLYGDPLSLSDRNLCALSCVLINAKTGEVLYEKNADVRRYPASTTKIITLLLAVENKKLSAKVQIPQAAADIAWDSSVVPVTVGETMLFRDLLYGLMIKSGNDAANAIAEIVGGSVDSFVKLMNKKAATLGMNDTHFANPHGYHDDNHYTTARDMAKLTYEALKNEKFRNIVTTKSYTMAATEKRAELVLTNSYTMLNPSAETYYPYAYGIKTGYTSKAGQCYVVGAQKDGMDLVAVVMHSGMESKNKWTEKDAAELFNYGFAALGY